MRRFEYISNIKKNFDLPSRSTAKSAGYDFINPKDIIINPQEIVYVKTGVKAYMKADEVLILANRSSNPKKKGLILINGVGVIDADYYNNPDNEGEIAFAFYNITNTPVEIKAGEKLGQGIFHKYLITLDDQASGKRSGGFGSTGK